jgi:hypothetical protein
LSAIRELNGHVAAIQEPTVDGAIEAGATINAFVKPIGPNARWEQYDPSPQIE